MRPKTEHVDPVEQPVQLATRDGENPLLSRLGPGEPVPLEPLLPEDEAVALPHEEFYLVMPAVAKPEDVGREGIELQILGHHRRQPVDGLAEIHGIPTEMDTDLFAGPHQDTIPLGPSSGAREAPWPVFAVELKRQFSIANLP